MAIRSQAFLVHVTFLAAYFAINLLCAKLVWRKMSMFCMLYYFILFSAKSWNSASRKTKTCVSHTVNIMAISKITFSTQWNIKNSKFGFHGMPVYQRVTSKGAIKENKGSEWPDKHDKTWFGSLARGGRKFFCVVVLPNLTVWALGWFE